MSLHYSVQNKLITTSMGEDQWTSLGVDVRKYLFTISLSMEDAFRFNSFPPGYVVEGWSRGVRSIFLARFGEWTRLGVDPRKHWGLFALTIPGKTGNQCRIFFSESQRQGQRYIPFIGPEIAENVAAIKQRLFRTIVAVFLQRAQLEVKDATEIFPGRGMQVGVTLCYAPPVLQLFARLDAVVDICRSQLSNADRSACPLVEDLIDIRHQLETPGNPVLIESIVQSLDLDTSEQQDVHEMFTKFTSRLHDELDEPLRNDFIDMICVQTFSEEKEGQVRDQIYSGLMTSINLTLTEHECTVQELLDGYFQDLSIMNEPRLLALHLIRQKVVTRQNGPRESREEYQIQKVMTNVACPDSVRLPSSGTEYRLIETIHHEGCDVDSGHYFAILYDTSRTVLIDGHRTVFLDRYERNTELRMAMSQVCMAIYQTNLDIRCWFTSKMSRDAGVETHTPAHPALSYVCSPGTPVALMRQPETWEIAPVSPLKSPVAARCRLFQKTPQRFEISDDIVTLRHRFLSQDEKLRIAHLSGGGVSQCDVARQVKRDKTTVGRFLKGQHGNCGSPRYSMLQDAKLQGIILNESLSVESKRLSCLRLSELIARKHGIQISKETVRQLRRIVGMRFLKPIPECLLTQDHKDKRVVFATDWVENRTHLLRRTPLVFTDESKVCLAEATRRLWRIPGQCSEGEYVSIAQHPVQAMVWGAVSVGFKSRLYWFRQTCNKETYIRMFEETGILETLNDLFGEFQYVLQQDNAPPHVARETTQWIHGRAHMVENWPAHSPDLNPIEVMWALMKQKIDVSNITTAAELFQRTEEAWEGITQEVVDNICSSFEARLRVVIHLRGNTLNGHWTLVHQVHIVLKNAKPEETQKMLTDVFSRDCEKNSNRTVQSLACSSPLLIVSEMERQADYSKAEMERLPDDSETEMDFEQNSDDEEEEPSECVDEGEWYGEEPPWFADREWNEGEALQETTYTENHYEENPVTAGTGSSTLNTLIEYVKGLGARLMFILGHS